MSGTTAYFGTTSPNHPGLFRTTNAGATFTKVAPLPDWFTDGLTATVTFLTPASGSHSTSVVYWSAPPTVAPAGSRCILGKTP